MEPRGGDVPKASLAGFVSTSVLTSSDGLFGDNVEEKRVTEAPAPRPEDAAGYKPLYEQLQELREKKDSDWKEKNNPFAPPKGLDDEEFDYIQDLETKRVETERKRNVQHEEDLAQFMLARGTSKSAPGAALTAQHLQKYPAKNDVKTTSKKKAAVVVVRAKLKVAKDKKRKSESKTAESPGIQHEQQQKNKKQKIENEAVASSSTVTKTKANGAALGVGLVAYGSDSDSDSGEGDTATSK
ncbi:hypothetical protein BBJ29_001094 [Phytophthora kernoviae]|uniref:FAM192A/Fyv6 N-terminal domain-containing protein n=1 Tax=Phytophthora kernoviae TaxID=325452 RepID=A0A3F2RVM8_9STRA|nr:hypothetical protein BBJ29_001094 [Phytophthora kernoviae]RLN65077.1 hypothetical protein BBP00_00003063 [Phytophthora kernoviae]